MRGTSGISLMWNSGSIVSLRWVSAMFLNKFVSFLELGLAFVSTVKPNSRRDTTFQYQHRKHKDKDRQGKRSRLPNQLRPSFKGDKVYEHRYIPCGAVRRAEKNVQWSYGNICRMHTLERTIHVELHYVRLGDNLVCVCHT